MFVHFSILYFKQFSFNGARVAVAADCNKRAFTQITIVDDVCRAFDFASVYLRRFALCNEGNVGGRESINANGRRPLRDIVRPINDFFRRRCSLHNNVASNPGIGYFDILQMSNYLFHIMLKQRFWRGIDF